MTSESHRDLFVLRIIVSVVIATCVGGIAIAMVWLFEPWAIGIGVGAATLQHLIRAARRDYEARRVDWTVVTRASCDVPPPPSHSSGGVS